MKPLEIPDDEMVVRFSRSSGPGGQNVNKRDTRAEVVFDIEASRALTSLQKARVRARLAHRLDRHGRLHVVSGAARTQAANRAAAVARLQALLERAVEPPPPPRRPTKPTKAAKSKRISEKKARGELKRARQRPAIED